ncbi:hypothetical protein QJS04_geneDACA018986 [Acorus gramineus]|uniref:Metallothionein n=1 Tax=Acorus gramineus TaxID=55184 RepID=A0AAV9ADV1_ACOGR|nr:hypothetical protein QJS04_geneDACA018986 [Acorus gramineus]
MTKIDVYPKKTQPPHINTKRTLSFSSPHQNMNKEKEKMADKGGVGTTIDAEKMADKGGVGTTTGTGGGCNEPCGCPTPCDGGNTCRCTGGSEAEHAVCKCGEHCSCNPCTCEKGVMW